jgi:hypothetical protein
VHRAFTTPLLNNQTSPTAKDKDLTDEISREESVVHTQRKASREEKDKEKYDSQPHELDLPLRFVGEEKVTTILLPSEVNSDR